jgi:hypothetical protein
MECAGMMKDGQWPTHTATRQLAGGPLPAALPAIGGALLRNCE